MSRFLAVVAGCSLIAGLLATPPVSAAALVPYGGLYTPFSGNGVRVLDTRSGIGGRLGAVEPGGTVTFTVSRPGPGGQTPAAVLDVTVPGNAPAGSLSVYPSGASWDRRVTMTLVGGGTIQKQLTVRLGADGGVTIRNNAARAMHLMVQAHGRYTPGTSTSPGAFTALNSRILDTRAASPLAAGGRLTVPLTGRGGIPAGGASAVVLNIAVLSARATGLLSITSAGQDMTPHIRFLGNQTMQTERVVKLGSDGKLTFSQSSASGVHLVLDVAGYFLPGEVSASGAYIPLGVRQLDSGERMVLRGRTPATVRVPVRQEAVSYNIVVSTDRPGQRALLGLYDSESPWNGSPTVSSSPALQPTELTVNTGSENIFVVRNLLDAPETWLHAYLTGYYNRDITQP